MFVRRADTIGTEVLRRSCWSLCGGDSLVVGFRNGVRKRGPTNLSAARLVPGRKVVPRCFSSIRSARVAGRIPVNCHNLAAAVVVNGQFPPRYSNGGAVAGSIRDGQVQRRNRDKPRSVGHQARDHFEFLLERSSTASETVA